MDSVLPPGLTVFDRLLWRQRRQRAVAHDHTSGFLFDEVANRLCERLDDVTLPFANIVDLGARRGRLASRLLKRPGTERIFQLEAAPGFAALRPNEKNLYHITADEEFLPLAKASVDLVIANLSLHWVNDLPGVLAQIRYALKPNGFFLAAMLGGETLSELRQAMMQADIALLGGTSPHVSPFANIRDLAGLLQRAGFQLTVSDYETITVNYRHPLMLMQELRAMGGANAVIARRRLPMRRTVLMQACQHYIDRFGTESGGIAARFDVLYMAGWTPS
jgi:SAM-dependent methyltransferase